jgi:hypothetical protein
MTTRSQTQKAINNFNYLIEFSYEKKIITKDEYDTLKENILFLKILYGDLE